MNEKIFRYLTLLFLFELARSLPVEDKLNIKKVFEKRAVDFTPFAHYPRPEGCSSPPNSVSVGLHMNLYNYPYLYVKPSTKGMFTNDTNSDADGETDGDSAGGIEGRAGQCWNPEYQDPNFPRFGYNTVNLALVITSMVIYHGTTMSLQRVVSPCWQLCLQAITIPTR